MRKANTILTDRQTDRQADSLNNAGSGVGA